MNGLTDEQYLEGWVRRGAWLVGGFVLLSLALGCGFVGTRLIAGETRTALAGSAVMLSCCTIGLVAWAGLRLAKLVMMNTTALERLRYRLDLLEARADLAADDESQAVATAAPSGQIPSSPTTRPSAEEIEATVRHIESVVAAAEARGEPVAEGRSNGAPHDPEIALCEAIERGDLVACRALLERSASALATERAAQLQGQVDALAAQRGASLRGSFRELVHEARFTEALALGERILRDVPERRIARDFESLRPLLHRKMTEKAEDESSSRQMTDLDAR